MTIIEKILICVTFLIIVHIGVDKTTNHYIKAPPTSKTSQTETENQKILDLGTTFQYFRDDYNAFVKEYEVPELMLRDIYWDTKTAKEKFYCNLGKTVVMFGDMDRATGELITVTVSCEPGKSFSYREILARATISYSFVIMTLSPELNQSDSAELIKKLSRNLKNYTVLEDDIRYRSRMYNGILMLSAEGKDYK